MKEAQAQGSKTMGLGMRPAIVTLSLIVLLGSIAHVQASSKIDCYPIENASKERCESAGCLWEPVNHDTQRPHQNHDTSAGRQDLNADLAKENTRLPNQDDFPNIQMDTPWCFFPDNFVGYKIANRSESGLRVELTRLGNSVVGNDVERILVEVEELGSALRLRITDVDRKRFEPELPQLQLNQFHQQMSQQTKDDMFSYEMDDEARLTIRRRSTGNVIFQTDLRKLIFSDKFIQLNSRLASPYLFGLGEHFDNFVKTVSNQYKVYSFWNSDRLPLPGGTRSYSGFPFYVSLELSGQGFTKAHGVYLRNSNAMDIIVQPDQSITFRPTGGILDFIIFSGPKPEDVVSQFQHLVGLPDLPPRWALGFHLCRYGYGTLDKTRLVWQRTKDTGIPFDIQWNDIDNMDRHNDFTFSHDRFKGLPEFIETLHNSSMYYMILFDPGVSQEDNYPPYSVGQQMDIFVKNATNQTLVGKVWNDSGRTVFPDFSNPLSVDYWTMMFVEFQKVIQFDGAWIDMNDISSFVYGSLDGCPKDNPEEHTPYRPGGYDLQTNTLCLSARHKAGSEYNVHNLYSFYEAIATHKALQVARPNKRPFIVSRSTSPGQGHYSNHWSGDVQSNWNYLRWSIPSLIEHSMFGFSLMGSDICGFAGNSNPELCARWSTLGAFYTFTRNHNDDRSIDQDPVAMGSVVVEANRNALTKRYSLIPYLYSLLHRAHKFGETAVKSVAFEFFPDQEALKVEYQLMWGRALMVSPVVTENTNSKTTYLPEGRWYETDVKPTEGVKVPKWIDSKGEWVETKHIDLTDIPLFYRGGHILPVYPIVHQTIAETSKQPFGLEIALCQRHMARGELYVDQGDNVDGKYSHLSMSFENNKLSIVLDHDDYEPAVSMGQIKVFGISKDVNGIKANERPVSFVRSNHVVVFDLEGIRVTKEQPLLVELY